ncbi:MAG: hypothetical protein OXE97_07790 [Gammaproteobacteria bacterium]|nr:hypothetical protein [Gammaproteobacteria bacterium]MCY4210927.1 hypothetical protein [Gammaproteobacteria bacterium]
MNLFARIVFMGVMTSLILITGNTKPVRAEQKRICSVSSADLTNISYSIFDQSIESPYSWRCIAERGEFKLAQELVDQYIATNKAKLDVYEIQNLFFHSGQLAAIDGRYKDAISNFSQAIDHEDTTGDFLSWNEYVYGTIFFLEGNIEKLKQEIEKIKARNIEFDSPNLQILNNFLMCPNETYRSIYSQTSSCLNSHH